MSHSKQILTEHVFPPVPSRQYDWSAIYADTYEPGGPIGRGPTEQAAIDNLLEQNESGPSE